MNSMTARKRTACDRCRKLKVACRKLDLSDDACERCLRAGVICLTENDMLPQSGTLSPALSASGWPYNHEPQSTDSGNAQHVPLPDTIPTDLGTYSSTNSDSNTLGFTPSEWMPPVPQDDVLTASHLVDPDMAPSWTDADLDSHADRMLWDISRQLTSLRDAAWDPQSIRLAWLDVDFSVNRPAQSAPEVLLSIISRYIMLLQILPPTNRMSLKLMLLSTYIELTQSIDAMLTDLSHYAQDPGGLGPAHPGSETLQPKYHLFALVRSFDCQISSMESLLGLPAEYRVSSDNAQSYPPFSDASSWELLSAVMRQHPQADETQVGGDRIPSLRIKIDQISTYLQASFA